MRRPCGLGEQRDEHVALGERGEEVAARVVGEDRRDLRVVPARAGAARPSPRARRRGRCGRSARAGRHLGVQGLGADRQPRGGGDERRGDRAVCARAEDRAPLVVLAQVEVAQRLLLEDRDRHAPRAGGPDPQVVEQRLGQRELDRHLAAHELLGEQVDGLDAAVDPARLVGQQLQAGERDRPGGRFVELVGPRRVHAPRVRGNAADLATLESRNLSVSDSTHVS